MASIVPQTSAEVKTQFVRKAQLARLGRILLKIAAKGGAQ